MSFFKTSSRIKSAFLSAIFAVAMVFSSNAVYSVALEDVPFVGASLANEFTTVNTETSKYLSEHLPFMAGLGRNDYRAALPGAKLLPISLMVSGGFGIGVMSDFNSIQDSSDQITEIGTGDANLDSLPFLVGPAYYIRVALPTVPVIGGFDFGLKVQQKLEFSTDDLKYENGGFGLDIRYAILRDIPLIPLIHLSLAGGVSFDQLKGKYTANGAISGGGLTIDGSFAPEWTINTTDIFLQATAKIFIFSIKAGAAIGFRGGETKTTLSGVVSDGTNTEAFDSIVAKKKASGTDVKLMAGLGITFFPFLTLYFEGNQNTTTGDFAGSAAINFVF